MDPVDLDPDSDPDPQQCFIQYQYLCLTIFMWMYVIQETDRLLGQQYTDTDSGFYNKVIGDVFACCCVPYLPTLSCYPVRFDSSMYMYLCDPSAVEVIIRL